MEPQGSLPYSQAPATCPYPEPTPSSPHNPLPTSWRSILILSSHLRLGLSNGSLSLRFPHQNLVASSIRATWPAHLIILDFITRTILGEGYRSLSSSLCNFLQYPVTGSNDFLVCGTERCFSYTGRFSVRRLVVWVDTYWVVTFRNNRICWIGVIFAYRFCVDHSLSFFTSVLKYAFSEMLWYVRKYQKDGSSPRI